MKNTMEKIEQQDLNLMMLGLVNRYMTPFATVLVLSAAFMSGCPENYTIAAVAILLVTWIMNLTTKSLIARHPEKMSALRNVRVVLNYVFDLALIWLFLPYWPSIWMLFLLVIIAVGAYEEKKAVIQHAALLTVMLCVATAARGTEVLAPWRGADAIAQWGDTAIKAAALWFVGLFTNRLLASTR